MVSNVVPVHKLLLCTRGKVNQILPKKHYQKLFFYARPVELNYTFSEIPSGTASGLRNLINKVFI